MLSVNVSHSSGKNNDDDYEVGALLLSRARITLYSVLP